MLAISLALNGVVLGSILLLASLGLTLIYGVGRIVNFAHGALFSLGAMCGVWLAGSGMPFWLALLLAPIAAAVLGIVIDWALLARIRGRGVDSLLLTFGLGLLVTGVLYHFGAGTIHTLSPPSMLSGAAHVSRVSIPRYHVFVSVLAIVLTVALLVLLRETSWGVRVRAANDDAEMAACLGINRETLMHAVVALSCALVALAGAAATPIFTAYASVGDNIILLAFMTVIAGGLGSVRGAIVAAYLVATITVFGQAWFGGQLALMIMFVLVMAMLIRWPRGFFGEGRTE